MGGDSKAEGGKALDVQSILNDMESGTGTSTNASLTELTGKIKEIGNGGYNIVFIIACMVFAIGLIIFFIKLFTANPQERSFMKWDIVWKCAAIACAFGAIAIVTLLARFGKGLFETTKPE